FLHVLTKFFPSLVITTLVGFPQCGHRRATLADETGLITSTISDFLVCPSPLTCFLNTLTPSTTNLLFLGSTKTTLPVFPESFPYSILTVSDFLIFIIVLLVLKKLFYQNLFLLTLLQLVQTF